MYEKNIMAELHHPFLIRLVNSYQDDNCVYILLDLIQGGELYNYIHTKNSNKLSEDDARFYSACIAEGLGFMHRRGYVYRDCEYFSIEAGHPHCLNICLLLINVFFPTFRFTVKPENVLIDQDGKS